MEKLLHLQICPGRTLRFGFFEYFCGDPVWFSE
jgi:hypothetical protein